MQSLLNAQTPAAPQTPAPEITVEPLVSAMQRAFLHMLDQPAEALALDGALTAIVIAAAWLAIRLIIRGLNWAAAKLARREGEETPKKVTKVGAWARRLTRLVVSVIAILLILRIWGVDVVTLTGGVLGPFFAVAWRVALVLVLAFAALEIAQLAVNGLVGRAADKARDLRRSMQLRTIAPVLSASLTTIIVVIAALMLLAEIGVNVAPLLAGAGIVGLAVGFGAQTIVKDFITGLFLIIEDVVSVGDDVQVNDVSGAVEAMSLRTIQLRDFDGTLHVFPYSEAQVIHNRTRTFSCAVIEITISYLSDIDRALAVIEETAAALRKDEKLASVIIAPPEILGVDKLTDFGMLIKGRIRTKPGMNAGVTRAFYRNVKIALDEAGILLGHRHQGVPPFDRIADRAKP